MLIKDVIKSLETKKILGNLPDQGISGLSSDSRKVRPGHLFVAVRGSQQDGHAFVAQAVKAGAGAVVLEDEACVPEDRQDAVFIVVGDSRRALAALAEMVYGFPQRQLNLCAVTGTNGKTSLTYLTKSILESAGHACGVIGTIGYQLRQENIPLKNTTPGILELEQIFQEMVGAGDDFAVMEVSSHALDQGRVSGLSFRAAVFTNLTQDHLDYHKDFEDYFRAKSLLFLEHLDKRGTAIINRDDSYGQRLVSLCQSQGRKVLTYGLEPGADIRAEKFSLSPEGTEMCIRGPRLFLELRTPLIGRHNVLNILAAAALAVSLRISEKHIQDGIERLSCVPGRLQRIPSACGLRVFVDYAHTDDALKNVLESLRAIADNGRIITVFGCGGDRDRGKRPKMGRVASMLSDVCLITSDNPRSEDPLAIVNEIVSGITRQNFEIELDRAKAIARALDLARPEDIVLVAGKGHETEQIIAGKVYPFDDREVVKKALALKDHV